MSNALAPLTSIHANPFYINTGKLSNGKSKHARLISFQISYLLYFCQMQKWYQKHVYLKKKKKKHVYLATSKEDNMEGG